MPEFKAPLRDMQFILQEVFNANDLWQAMPDTAEITEDLVTAVLTEGAKICEQELFPLNVVGDEKGCRLEDGQVYTPPGFKAAFETFANGGWAGLGGNPEFGGQGLPKMVTSCFFEMMIAANPAFTLYPILTNGVCVALEKYAEQWIKDLYLPKFYSGEWTGTMCLTEAHSGTDLGLLRTKAVPCADGSYELTGTKIFITSGDHDFVDNIVHLVLAKLPDAPAGSKGISLFIVPKWLPNSDGSLTTDRNPVQVSSIEHKMGIHGSPTCVMNFDGARGWMVGEPNQGLAAMFVMMNYERLSIGLQGLGASEIAYQQAAAYAQERLQGRAATGPQAPEKSADPIIVHPDVRRMLLTIRSRVEAGRAFSCYATMQLDISQFHPDAEQRQRAQQLVDLLTPVVKSYLTDCGFEDCVMAQQVFGGHGYINETGMEQLVRDARIGQIYEGTNGIQALDLMGRKVIRSGGKLLTPFYEDIERLIQDHQNVVSNELQRDFVQPLQQAVQLLQRTTANIIDTYPSDPNTLSAAAVNYLNLFGLIVYAFMWTKMALIAEQRIKSDDSDFYQAKLYVGKFFMSRILPQTLAYEKMIASGPSSLMEMPNNWF